MPGNDLLSRVLRRSTIGAGAFHVRVRKGIGCSHPAIATRQTKQSDINFLVRYTPARVTLSGLFLRRSNAPPKGPRTQGHESGPAQAPPRRSCQCAKRAEQRREAIKDQHCLMRAFKPIELLVPVSYTCHHASTPGLSTWWSTTTLREY